MINSNPQMNILFSDNFMVVDCNPAALRFMGFETKEDMLAGFPERNKLRMPNFRLDGWASTALVERLVTAAKAGFKKFNIELLVCGVMRNLDVEFRKVPYKDSFVTMSYIYDMTEMREREMELIRVRDLNKLQLAKLNLMVKASKIGLWDMEIVQNDPVNPMNPFIYSNEFRYMLEYSNEIDFPDVIDSWINLLHPDDKERAVNDFKNHLFDKTGKTPYDIECRLSKKNGEYAYYRISGETIRDNDGNAIRVAGALVDITKTKNIILDTEMQRIKAEAASKAKSSFLSAMSHEIRTPMNAIIGMTAIARKAQDMEKMYDALKKIDGASRHLLGVINDVLDMSKIEADKFDLSITSFDFKKMLQKIADVISFRTDERRQKFHIGIGREFPAKLIGDDQRLSQVITNLLSNAAKFTPEDGTISLEAQLISEEDGVCRLLISVEDTGIGITDEQKARLFKPFEQAESDISRKFGGTGLGLAISKRIVELMDGEIWVESEPGKGSKFIFTVLLKRGSEDNIPFFPPVAVGMENEYSDVDNAMAQDEEIEYADNFANNTMLLAEDVEINREIVLALLKPTELNIVCVENGVQAVKMFESAPSKYDIILMDVQMPEMNGYEATRAIRALNTARAKSIPIIAITANVFREDIEKCIEAGMNDHIGKPLNLNEIMKKMRSYLGNL